ncbi:hypothetical protein N7478_007702 [Penicillium angulare]|uniref:uncharacterized protein n=1 Tax=Penicillium angulare TaxID=116970 RepID=UPI002540B69C|nr:uncharacterized protein N7478_007702 [Penicillium angulare]KAJ5272577.1 hypothetical protein N7478_007702 [Penicillium angulare]
MFSSFNSRDRLRRSMSTRSMRRTRTTTESDSVDPELAKVHAAAAASRAMRSGERPSTDSKTSYDRLGGPAHVAIPRRRPNSSFEHTDHNNSRRATPTIPPRTPRQSSESNGSVQTHCRENPAVLPTITEFNGLDGRDSSVPSSYRRLRKAKSMFSTRQRLSQLTNGTPPMPHGQSPGPDVSPGFALPRTLRNSTSFTRGNRQGTRLIRHAKSQDVAIQLARRQYLDENSDCDAQPRRTSFLVSRRQKEHKPFRKTFRTTSDGGAGASPSSGPSKSKLSHSQSRTFSASLKQGFRRVFGLSKPTEHVSEPQPIPAPEDSENPETRQSFDMNTTDLKESTHHSTASSPLRVPVISPSRTSICTSDTCATGWPHSTAANTTATRQTGHRKSLSLIEEHGDLNRELPQDLSHESRQSPSRKRSSARNFNAWLNTQDLYTALMQQISRNSGQSAEGEVTMGSVPEHRVITEHPSSIQSHRSKRTVRRVPSGESSVSPHSFATARGEPMSPQKLQRPMGYVRPLKVFRYMPGKGNTRPPSAFSDRNSKYPMYIVGTDSDSDSDGTGSVIIARPGSTGELPSPSVYSRTVSGDTPTKETDKGLSGRDIEDGGTATIFASERTAWSSPGRRYESQASRAPSADWQQWMSSQIERIERASPTREHIREDAQFQDEDEIFTNLLRQAQVPGLVLTEPPANSDGECFHSNSTSDFQLLPQNNFSRPFSRSSSVRTILSSQKVDVEEPIKVFPKDPEKDAIDSYSQPIPSWSSRIPASPLSPMRLRNSNMLQIPESPTPPQRNGAGLLKRTWTQEQYRRYSARRPLNANPGSLRSIRSQRAYQGLNNENIRQEREHDDLMGEYHKLQDINSTVSSKRMVDMFLDSRRRQMGMDEADDESNNANEAFI